MLLDQRSCLPKHCLTKQCFQQGYHTYWILFSWIEVTMKDTLLHGFDETRRIYQHLYLVFDNDTCYDIILDVNLLGPIRLMSKWNVLHNLPYYNQLVVLYKWKTLLLRCLMQSMTLFKFVRSLTKPCISCTSRSWLVTSASKEPDSGSWFSFCVSTQ